MYKKILLITLPCNEIINNNILNVQIITDIIKDLPLPLKCSIFYSSL